MDSQRQEDSLLVEPLTSSVANAVGSDPEQTHSVRVIRNKISEKIKTMQFEISNCVAADCPDDTSQISSASKEPIKLNVSVKSLALNLNINPLALKVGAKPPMPRQLKPVVGLDKETSNELAFADANNDILSATTTTSAVLQEDDERGDPDNFIEAIKARAKIQSKRRPPTKRLLKALSMKETAETVEAEAEENYINSSKQLKLSLSGAKSDSDNIKTVEKKRETESRTLEEEAPEGFVSDAAKESAPILEPENAELLESREEPVEKTSKSKASSCLFYIMRLIIPRNLGGVVTVIASLVVFLIVSILIQTFITSQQNKL